MKSLSLILFLILHLLLTSHGEDAPEEKDFPSSVIMFNEDTASQEIFSSPIKKQLLFFTDENLPHHAPAMELFNSLAEEFQGVLLVIRIAFTETDYVNHFHVTSTHLPALFAIDMSGGMKKIPYGGDVLDVEPTRAFVSAFANRDVVKSTEF